VLPLCLQSFLLCCPGAPCRSSRVSWPPAQTLRSSTRTHRGTNWPQPAWHSGPPRSPQLPHSASKLLRSLTPAAIEKKKRLFLSLCSFCRDLNVELLWCLHCTDLITRFMEAARAVPLGSGGGSLGTVKEVEASLARIQTPARRVSGSSPLRPPPSPVLAFPLSPPSSLSLSPPSLSCASRAGAGPLPPQSLQQ